MDNYLPYFKGDKIHRFPPSEDSEYWLNPAFRKLFSYHDFTILRRIPWFWTKLATGLRHKLPFSESMKFVGAYRFPKPYPEKVAPQLILELIRKRYDVVIWTTSLFIEAIISFFIVKILRRKFIVSSEEWLYKKSALKRIVSVIQHLVIRHSDACLGYGIKQRDFFLSVGASPDEIFTFGNWARRPTPTDISLALDIKNKLRLQGRKIVLYLGRLIERKGIQYLLYAFSNLVRDNKPVHLIIAGEGNYEKTVRQVCKDLAIEKDVTFVGFIEPNERVAHILTCDVTVVPSIWWEGAADPYPSVLIQAVCAGRPVIATTAVGSAYDWIEDGVNGHIVPERDAAAIENGLRTILFEEGIAEKMGECSHRIASKFGLEKMVGAHLAAIEHALNRRIP